MKQQRREDLATGGHTEVEWDDETGDFDLTEYDASGEFVQRRKREFINPDAGQGELVAQDIHLDTDGKEIERTNYIRGKGVEPEPGGWS